MEARTATLWGLVTGSIPVCLDQDRLSYVVLVGTKGLRRPIPGWECKSINASHSEVGGVTLEHATITALSLRLLRRLAPVAD
eukprot:scaffold286175_cov51-Attheya_sp.AAC.2